MGVCGKHGRTPDVLCPTCHVAAHVTQLAQEGRVRLAPQVLVEVYADEIEEIRKACRIRQWLVTDDSAIVDVALGDLDKLRARLGVEIRDDDTIIDVAKRLRAR